MHRQRFPDRFAQHHLHEIEPGDQLGDGMLHLQAGIHLQEVEVPVAIEHELDRPGRAIPGGSSERDGRLPHPHAKFGTNGRRWRLLDDLLMPPLQGAVSLPKRDDVSVRIREDLDLHVANRIEIAFEQEQPIPEGSLRLTPRRVEGIRKIFDAV